jgi:hypothetical protein
VIDGGVYHDHEDLKDNMWVNEAELNGAPGVDDDRNGYVDDIYGYDFINRTGTISPDDHGTHVAGVIAAVTDNGVGVSGISGNQNDGFGIKIMTVQILDGNKSVLSIGPAFAYAADNGAVIAQNSWGYEEANVYNRTDIEAINYFIKEAGKDKNGLPRHGTPMTGGIVIFAAGNDNKDDKWYPAYFDNVLAVAATNHDGKLARYSKYGNWVNISAPGGEITGRNETGGIYSTSYRAANSNYYEYMQGTSMACPHVSGVAALVLSVYGNECYTPDMLRSRLLLSATPLDMFDPVNASKMGAGLVNASTALTPGSAPENITDLSAEMINAVSCRLNWTVPQAEDNGQVSYYIVSNATEEITEENFDRYAQKPTAMSEKAGTIKEATITGLFPETTYYVAMRSSDYQYNISAISNVATFTTAKNQPPVFDGLVTDTALIPYSIPVEIDLKKYAYDPEEEPLTFAVQTSKEGIVDADINGNILIIKPQRHGDVLLQITASDPHAAQTTTTIHVTVEQKYAPDKPNQLLVYPNPTSDILWFSYILNKSASVSVRIVTSNGQIMFQTPTEKQSAGTYYYNTNLQGWSNGVYIVQFIKDGKTVNVKKMVKQL